jgi:NADH-ubiquinone oxidoreductase chain 1
VNIIYHIYIIHTMIYLSTFVSILEVILLSIPVVLAVAYVTVAERKTMASMQRRLGPNIVGYYGLLQAFADAFKLLLKEYVSPTQANLILFFLGPIITLLFSLLGYGVIPYAPGLTIFDFNLGILYLLAVSSLSTYGILLAGWSANSKYAFLGSLRSTAQLISYELILSSAILLVVLLTSSLNLTVNIEYQKAVWFLMPLFPVFIIFFISSVAETNRAPFDLAEAESELVSGFMTEHAAVIFVFFFLAEYASIVLICILTSILFLGGYLLNIVPLLYILYSVDIITIVVVNILDYFFSIVFGGSLGNFANNIDYFSSEHFKYFIYSLNDNKVINNPLIEGIVCGIILGIKSSLMIFVFIWVRASFPRIRFDQLMSFCWTVLLPLVFAFIVLVPCILYSFEILPNNILL